jgi:hypothetical protein
LNSGIQSFETKRLFRLLLTRSFQQLFGAQFHADCKSFHLRAQVVDVRASSLAPSGDLDLALVARDQPDVYLFNVEAGGLVLKRQLRTPWDQPGVAEVLKTALDGEGGAYVLQRFTPTVDEDDPDAEHPFVKHAMQSSPSGNIYLVYHESDSPFGQVRMCTFPDHADFTPLAIAVTRQDEFAISWQHIHNHNEHEVVLYTQIAEPNDDSSDIVGS